PRKRRLIDHSTLVMSLRAPDPDYLQVVGWISDHEVLCCYDNTIVGSFTSYTVFDTNTGAKRSLSALNHILNKSDTCPMQLSPDRHSLFLATYNNTHIVAHLNGSRTIRLTIPNEEPNRPS